MAPDPSASAENRPRHIAMVATVTILLLVIIANGTPVLTRNLLGERFTAPLDGGRQWRDGRALFGRSKTVRGIVAALIATTAAAQWLGLGWAFGLIFGLLAMLGDLLSSFLKRRRGLAPSSRARGLDQIPESLFPAAFATAHGSLSLPQLGLVVVLFFLLETTLSPVLFRLGIRDRPY